jgi:hypothetical protein
MVVEPDKRRKQLKSTGERRNAALSFSWQARRVRGKSFPAVMTTTRAGIREKAAFLLLY